MLKYCTLRKLDKNRSIEFYGVGGLGQIAHASKQHGYKIILRLRKFDYNDKGHPSYLITSNFKFEKASSDYI